MGHILKVKAIPRCPDAQILLLATTFGTFPTPVVLVLYKFARLGRDGTRNTVGLWSHHGGPINTVGQSLGSSEGLFMGCNLQKTNE